MRWSYGRWETGNYTEIRWQIRNCMIGDFLKRRNVIGEAAGGTASGPRSGRCMRVDILPRVVTGRLFLGGRCNWDLGRRAQRRGGVDPLRDVRPAAYSAPEGKVGA